MSLGSPSGAREGGSTPLQSFIDTLEAEALPASLIAADLAAKLKFAECLPEEIVLEVAAARVSDPDGVRRVLGEPIDTVREAT